MSWENQKKLKKLDLDTPEQFKEKINNIPDKRIKAYIALSYLTAGRVSEVIKIRRRDLSFSNVNVRGINRQIFNIHMPNRKHKERHTKDIPIVMATDHPVMALERELCQAVWDYCAQIPQEIVLFAVTRQTAFDWIKKYTQYHPHWLRHMRATHLVTIKDFPPFQLQKYMGHSDLRPIKHYMELSKADLIDKMDIRNHTI